MFHFLAYGPFPDVPSVEEFFEIGIRQVSHTVIWAIIDKTRIDAAHPELGGSLAGVIGLLNASPQNLMVEIGHIAIFPSFQRTHVNTNAVGLLLNYSFDHPTSGGLGLRRVQWQAHASNAASVGAAKRFGMQFEGIARWQRALPGNKEGARRGNEEKTGRHTAILAVCWDDWENGVKEHVARLMARTK